MGAKDSKRTCLGYDEAVKRMSDVEFKRVCEAFKRLTGGNAWLSRQAFVQYVLGDGVPKTIAESLYGACGGTPRGILLRDLVCGLVLLTKGTREEKIRFLWTLYSNDSCTQINKSDFLQLLKGEGALSVQNNKHVFANIGNYWDNTLLALFGIGHDKVNYEQFRDWIQRFEEATVLSKWLLTTQCVTLSSELETPTFYQSLAGVTHLEEQDICELEKCFWSLQSASASGQLDAEAFASLVSPPIPHGACAAGLFSALDVNRDGHIDFKELCCGISAACRGPTAERTKFCFKMFDADRDNVLNAEEVRHLVETLMSVTREHRDVVMSASSNARPATTTAAAAETGAEHQQRKAMEYRRESRRRRLSDAQKSLLDLKCKYLDVDGCLPQEDFLVWCVENDAAIAPLLELLFQVCHVALGLRPKCRHHEYEIVMGWLEREQHRGYQVGQFWYLISNEWWQSWCSYGASPSCGAPRRSSTCSLNNILDCYACRPPSGTANTSPSSVVDSAVGTGEEIVYDESFTSNSTDCTSHSNEFASTNSTDSMGDLLARNGGGSGNSTANGNALDTCSIASSSGVSSSSGNQAQQQQQHQQQPQHRTCSTSSSTTSSSASAFPGPIDNKSLAAELPDASKVTTLTGEGSRLRRDMPLVHRRDFELVPDSLWKALALWYGGPLPLPRQVIKAPDSYDLELELYPLNLKVLRHTPQQPLQKNSWASTVGGYGAAALSTATGMNNNSSGSSLVVGHHHHQQQQPLTGRCYVAHTAAFSRLANVRQVVEFLALRLALRLEDVRLWLCKEAAAPLLLEEDSAVLEELGIVDGDRLLLEVRNKDLTWPEELGALASGSNSLPLSTMEKRRPTISLPPGATGLHNLGNTCFMNAALQAVSNTRPLTQYFQRDAQLCELNSANPLGTKGQVAKRYAELCRELWAGSTRSVAPLKLRWCVSKHAPHLGGGGQHDSQELLAWLLDALHEDLNRVPRKQYTELRDSDGRPDTIVADEAWKQHLARDHSIITDLFYGQLKSKVTCQTCGHESVRFDAFNLLSLPLPMESFTLCEVLVVRLNGHVPVKYGLRLNSEARYGELKKELETLSGVPAARLLVAEVAYSQIRQVMNDECRLNASIATDLYAYELPPTWSGDDDECDEGNIDDDASSTRYGGRTSSMGVSDPDTEAELVSASSQCQSPLARSPEVRSRSALCMPNILCFKNARANSIDLTSTARKLSNGIAFRRQPQPSSTHSNIYTDVPLKTPTYLVAVHRKCVRQETYFLSQHKSKPSLFGVPLLLGCSPHTTCQSIYKAVWEEVTRLLSPMPQSDQTNHATDCDDSLGYEFPFTLKAVLQGGQICALCNWTQFCRGCQLPCTDEQLLFELCRVSQNEMCIAIDWDPTALHLRYQSSREKLWREHESVAVCRKLHTEPIDLDHCLKAFTSEERLEAKYHCGNCNDKQPATKKLQIWRLPPILIVHLKRFDFCNEKWVKTQKSVNFPFANFDPTAYLASVPQETILRHRQLQLDKRKSANCCAELDAASSPDARTIVEEAEADEEQDSNGLLVDLKDEETKVGKVFSTGGGVGDVAVKEQDKSLAMVNKRRQRLESTSLLKTPIIDGDLQDFHQHKLLQGQDPFDLKYQLYAVVSHSGMLNGGHYISYACNPNGHWYCYNDSSCREVCNAIMDKGKSVEGGDNVEEVKMEVVPPKIDTSSAYILFYERSGLDYGPYFPDVSNLGGNGSSSSSSVVTLNSSQQQLGNAGGVFNHHEEPLLDENESELRKQCVLQ